MANLTSADPRSARRTAGAARLVAVDGAERDHFLLDERIEVGSARDNGVVLNASTVSRHHAAIERRGGAFTVADRGSTNGTFVNGARIAVPTRLRDGDRVAFGGALFVFVAPPRAARRPIFTRLIVGVGPLVLLFILGFLATRLWITRRAPNSAPPITHQTSSAVAAATGAHPPETAPARPAPPSAPIAARPSPAPIPPAPSAAGASVNLAKMLGGASAAAASAAAASAAALSAPAPGWLSRLNGYRAMAGQPPVTQDAALSAADAAHAHYLVLNYAAKIRAGSLGIQAHTEQPGTPGYSAAGASTARVSDVDDMWSSGDTSSLLHSIDGWVATPLHRLPILSPRLHRIGYGEFCQAGTCAAALDVGSDADPPPLGGVRFRSPVQFPTDGAAIPFTYFGNEWPNPLTSCPGYKDPAGVAITIQTGAYLTAHLNNYSVARIEADGSTTPLAACGFDATSYSNPDISLQARVRMVMKDYGAVVIIPRYPLEAGASYLVSATVDGQPLRWRFLVSRNAPAPPPHFR